MVGAKPMSDEAAAECAAALIGQGGVLWLEILDEDLADWSARLVRHHFPNRDDEAAKQATIASIAKIRSEVTKAMIHA